MANYYYIIFVQSMTSKCSSVTHAKPNENAIFNLLGLIDRVLQWKMEWFAMRGKFARSCTGSFAKSHLTRNSKRALHSH